MLQCNGSTYAKGLQKKNVSLQTRDYRHKTEWSFPVANKLQSTESTLSLQSLVLRIILKVPTWQNKSLYTKVHNWPRTWRIRSSYKLWAGRTCHPAWTTPCSWPCPARYALRFVWLHSLQDKRVVCILNYFFIGKQITKYRNSNLALNNKVKGNLRSREWKEDKKQRTVAQWLVSNFAR